MRPQMFYPVANNITITKGDVLVCTNLIWLVKHLPYQTFLIFTIERLQDVPWSAIERGLQKLGE